MEPRATVILFDGVCNLCSGVVRFVVARDPQARFRFASLQSDAARRFCAEHGIPAPDREALGSVIVITDDNRILDRSDAALAIAARLPFPWRILTILSVVPRPLRDWAYGAIARRRYCWFGRQDRCQLPDPTLRGRFLE